MKTQGRISLITAEILIEIQRLLAIFGLMRK